MKYYSSFFCLFRLRLQGSAPGPDVKQVEIWNSVCVCVCVYECVLLCVCFFARVIECNVLSSIHRKQDHLRMNNST